MFAQNLHVALRLHHLEIVLAAAMSQGINRNTSFQHRSLQGAKLMVEGHQARSACGGFPWVSIFNSLWEARCVLNGLVRVSWRRTTRNAEGGSPNIESRARFSASRSRLLSDATERGYVVPGGSGFQRVHATPSLVRPKPVRVLGDPPPPPLSFGRKFPTRT